MASIPATSSSETLDQRIVRLLRQWRAETAYISSSSEMTGHPAYQELIALGPPALPYLFRDLEQTGDGHLSKALAAITGARPVPPDDRGNIRRIAEIWLRWGRENGWQW